MTGNLINYKKLTSEEILYIKIKISKSSRTIKKWTKLLPKKEKVHFRDSIFAAFDLNRKYDISKIIMKSIPSHRISELLSDLDTIYAPKMPDEKLGGKSIEFALISGYIPLFTRWCRGNQDRLSDFIIKVMDSMYLFTKPRKSIVEYLKRCHSRFRALSSNGIIRIPNGWNVLRGKFERNKNENPSMSVEQIIEIMNLTKNQRKTLLQQIKMTDFISIGHVLKPIDLKTSELDPIFEININEVPLTDLQRLCVDAHMHGVWGWQTKLAEKTINQKTNKPYTKMSINNHFKDAIDAIRDYLGTKLTCISNCI